MNNNNQKFFLAPVSSSELYKNYHKSVLLGIEKKIFSGYNETNQYNELIKLNNQIRIWGVKNSKLTPYNKAAINDIVLFYHKGFIVGRATICFKDKNQYLSKKIWGSDIFETNQKKMYWENLLFLKNYIYIHLDFNVLINYASYSPKASVRGFNEYSPVGMISLLNEHKTIENFLLKYQK
jgi:hypothetical protein